MLGESITKFCLHYCTSSQDERQRRQAKDCEGGFALTSLQCLVWFDLISGPIAPIFRTDSLVASHGRASQIQGTNILKARAEL